MGCGVAGAGAVARGAGGGAGAGVVEGGGVTGAAFVLAATGASPAGVENRPLLAATVALVITGRFDAARLVRFAAATSGESSAETTPARTRRIREERSMVDMITDRGGGLIRA